MLRNESTNHQQLFKRKLLSIAVLGAIVMPTVSVAESVNFSEPPKLFPVQKIIDNTDLAEFAVDPGIYLENYERYLFPEDKKSLLTKWVSIKNSAKLEVPNEIRMTDLDYVEQLGGTIKAKYLNVRRTEGSGVRDYYEGNYISRLTFNTGSLYVDRMDIYLQAKYKSGEQNYDGRAWGVEFNSNHGLHNLSGDGNAKINILGVKGDNAEAVGVIYKLRPSGKHYTHADFNIQNIEGQKTSATGLQFIDERGSLKHQIMDGTVNIENVSVKDSTKGSNVYGIYAYRDVDIIDFTKNVSIKNLATDKGNIYGVKNESGADLRFNGGIQIYTDLSALKKSFSKENTKNEIAIFNEYQLTIADNENAKNIIIGNIVNKKTLIASFSNQDSYFQGAILPTVKEPNKDDPATILNFKNGGQWLVTQDSKIKKLHLENNGILDLTSLITSDNIERNIHIKTDVLNADQGIAKLHLDIANQQNGSLITTGDASGKLNVQLNVENLTQSFNKSEVPLIVINDNKTETGQFEIGELTYQRGAAQQLELQFFEKDAVGSEGAVSSNANGGWFLVNPNASHPPVTNEVDQVLSLGTSLTQSLGMLSETEDLRMRMGDVRYGDSDGFWGRTYSRKDTAHGSFGNGFMQHVHGFHLGADHVIRTDNNASWLVGGVFHYGKSDIEGAAEAGGGDAKIDQYTVKAYATYMNDNGTFADLVLHTGYYDTSITGLDNTGKGNFKADYNNWGYGISAEVGHRFDLGNVLNTWYVEPTAQLTWFHADGKNIRLDTGLEVDQSDADFITGRLGGTFGKVFALGTSDDPTSSYLSVAFKGGMLYQFDGDQSISAHGTDGAIIMVADAMDMKGARAYYGLTADWKIDNSWRMYGQLSREEGSGYTKDYDASIGIRYSF